MSAVKAIEKYLIRLQKKQQRSLKPRRKNNCPEKDLEKKVLPWLKSNGLSVNVVESKSTFNPKVGRYISSPIISGFSDIVGASPEGIGCFIELKAPGKLSTLRPNQRFFLIEKIECGCFAVVIDSVARLESLWLEFKNARQLGVGDAANCLKSKLPKVKLKEWEIR